MTLKEYYENLDKRKDFILEVMGKCGIKTESSVYRYLSGSSTPDKLKKEVISEITGIPVEELFTEEIEVKEV